MHEVYGGGQTKEKRKRTLSESKHESAPLEVSVYLVRRKLPKLCMRRTEADKPKKSESGHLAKASTKVHRLERVDNEEKRVFNMARKKIIAGNWKMNMTPSQAVALVNELKPLVETEEADVVFCVPAIDIIPAMEAAKGSNIVIGAENMYYEEKGAYTGEIAPDMLTDAGVKYVIIGHSERREYFKETDEDVNKKVLKALSMILHRSSAAERLLHKENRV